MLDDGYRESTQPTRYPRKSAIICPMCDSALKANEGLVIRPIDNGTTDVMRIIHVDYSKGVRTLHESDSYTRLKIDY